MIDLALLRREPDDVKAALARRGISSTQIDEILSLDAEHRTAMQAAEALRSQVKDLSRQVGEARKSGDTQRADQVAAASRELGDEERRASEIADAVGDRVRALLLDLPNMPAAEAPDGVDETGNVELRQWWPGMDQGAPFPTYEDYQRVPHWDIGAELGLLDLETGAKLAGSMFPLFRGDGSRLVRALGAYALNQHADEYEFVLRPSR